MWDSHHPVSGTRRAHPGGSRGQLGRAPDAETKDTAGLSAKTSKRKFISLWAAQPGWVAGSAPVGNLHPRWSRPCGSAPSPPRLTRADADSGHPGSHKARTRQEVFFLPERGWLPFPSGYVNINPLFRLSSFSFGTKGRSESRTASIKKINNKY